MSNSVVGDDCELDKSVVGENVSIGDSCKLLNCVIGDGVTVKTGTILEDSKIDF
jgi:ADP-glucose pyrophosphorylase